VQYSVVSLMLHYIFLKASCDMKLYRIAQERHAAVEHCNSVFRVSLAPFSHAIYCFSMQKGERKREPRNRPRKTHRVSGGIAQLFLNLGTRRWCVWSASGTGRLYRRERPGTHCTGGWVDPGTGLDRCGKSRPTGIRSPDLPVRIESLCPLSYLGSFSMQKGEYIPLKY
jgi:hypothetical protein